MDFHFTFQWLVLFYLLCVQNHGLLKDSLILVFWKTTWPWPKCNSYCRFGKENPITFLNKVSCFMFFRKKLGFRVLRVDQTKF